MFCTESYCTRLQKALNMCHQAQKGFCGILVIIPQHQKGYLLYVPSTRKIVSSYDVVVSMHVTILFRNNGFVSICDIYILLYIFEGTNWRYNNVSQFEEGGLLSENRNDTESGDESNDDSIMPPLISEE